MRLIHDVHFSPQEFEFYRQLVFNNITHGMKQLLETLPYLDLEVPQELEPDAELLEDPPDVKDGQPFPTTYLEPLRRLWQNETVRKGWLDGKAAVPDKCADLSRSLLAYTYAQTPISVYLIFTTIWNAYSRATSIRRSRILYDVRHGRLASRRLYSSYGNTKCSWWMLVDKRANGGNGSTASRR